jgi:hypothetical protein
VICQPCMDAADIHAPRDQHCHDPGCTCGHRVDRYRTGTGFEALTAFHRMTDETRAREAQYREALPGRMAQIAGQLTAQLPAQVQAAGIHFAYDTTPTHATINQQEGGTP